MLVGMSVAETAFVSMALVIAARESFSHPPANRSLVPKTAQGMACVMLGLVLVINPGAVDRAIRTFVFQITVPGTVTVLLGVVFVRWVGCLPTVVPLILSTLQLCEFVLSEKHVLQSHVLRIAPRMAGAMAKIVFAKGVLLA